MTDGYSYVPVSQRAGVPKPGDLLTDENVLKILNTIPDPMHRSFLIRHMLESERSSYCQGVADGKRQATTCNVCGGTGQQPRDDGMLKYSCSGCQGTGVKGGVL